MGVGLGLILAVLDRPSLSYISQNYYCNWFAPCTVVFFVVPYLPRISFHFILSFDFFFFFFFSINFFLLTFLLAFVDFKVTQHAA